jgi:hypothetical protein
LTDLSAFPLCWKAPVDGWRRAVPKLFAQAPPENFLGDGELMDPNFKHDVLYDGQQQLITSVGRETFLKELNFVNLDIFEYAQGRFPDINPILLAIAFDSLSMKIVEKLYRTGGR